MIYFREDLFSRRFIFAKINFRVDKFSRLAFSNISRGLIFADAEYRKISRGLIFAIAKITKNFFFNYPESTKKLKSQIYLYMHIVNNTYFCKQNLCAKYPYTK